MFWGEQARVSDRSGRRQLTEARRKVAAGADSATPAARP